MLHTRRTRVSALCLFLMLVCLDARRASAELVFFPGGRSMSVRGHRFDGDLIVVSLRGGGEMTFDRSLIERIGPDEVSYDDPTAQNPSTMTDSLELVESPAFDPMIQRASAAHHVDVRLVKAVIQAESAYQPRARSPKGAMGLMQLMPDTAKQFKARNPYDPRTNIDAGTRYLRTLLDQFELPLALAAYNAGEAAVRRFGGIPPFPETQAYVTKVLALAGPAIPLR